MSDQFLGEIRMFAGNFAPTGWAFCNGQLLTISQNTALFSLLGTQYGGNGTTNFALPNLQGAVPINVGQGGGLTARAMGETGGAATVTLDTTQLPLHAHTARATTGAAATEKLSGGRLATSATNVYASPGGATTALALGVSANAGGQPHDNMQPYLAVTFIIALQGIFPSRP